MAERVNTFLDNLLALSSRILDFPLYILFPLILLSGLLILVFLKLIFRKFYPGKKNPHGFLIIFLLFLLTVVADIRIRRLENSFDLIYEKMALSQGNIQNSPNSVPDIANAYNFEQAEKEFEGFSAWTQNIHPAVDLITLRKENPKAVSYISVIDLSYPNLEICLTPEIKEKYLTSRFAKNNDCLVAINGEAGESMAQNSPLGEWTGNYIVRGKALLLEDSPERPFLSFDSYNKARYFKSSLVDTLPDPEKFNTIWGRFDLLVDGKYNALVKKEKAYARTCMAINREGNKLYLMIVDGKRPEYSQGMTYEECAFLLKSLGAYNGMACDQGGSSCIYVKERGIVNRPADNGYERFVYTHFGVKAW